MKVASKTDLLQQKNPVCAGGIDGRVCLIGRTTPYNKSPDPESLHS